MRSVRRLLAGTILAAFIAGAAALAAEARTSLPPERDRWIRIQTAHFTLFSNASQRRTLDLGKRLERFRAVLAIFYRKFRVDPPVPILIYVFKNDASFTPYKGRFNGQPVNVAGVFVDRPDGYYIAMNGDPGTDPLDIIYHEYTHQFLNNNLHNVPLWFNEGVAECYATFQADDDTASIGRLQNNHVLLLRSRALMPLRELFAITHESPDYNEGERQGIFYAESWTLVHYLMFDRPERRPQLGEFLDRLARGEDAEAAFAASFLTTFKKMEEELLAHVGQARFQFTVLKYSELPVDTGAAVSPMTREEALVRLGDLLVHTQPEARAAEAEADFQESLRLHPSFAPAYAGLGMVRDQAGRADDAVAFFEKALAADGGDAMTCFHLGSCLARRARTLPAPGGAVEASPRFARAQELLGKAIQLRPNFAEAYVEYARTIADADGNLVSATHLMEAARTMLPARADVVFNLAMLYARQGDRDRARDLVDNVLANMNAPEAVEAARAALQPAAGAAAATASPPPQGAATPAGEDPEVTETIDPMTTSPAEYNRQVSVYNQAVERGNRGDYAGAIAMLEDLLKQVRDTELRGRITKFLETLQDDAARRKKTRG